MSITPSLASTTSCDDEVDIETSSSSSKDFFDIISLDTSLSSSREIILTGILVTIFGIPFGNVMSFASYNLMMLLVGYTTSDVVFGIVIC